MELLIKKSLVFLVSVPVIFALANKEAIVASQVYLLAQQQDFLKQSDQVLRGYEVLRSLSNNSSGLQTEHLPMHSDIAWRAVFTTMNQTYRDFFCGMDDLIYKTRHHEDRLQLKRNLRAVRRKYITHINNGLCFMKQNSICVGSLLVLNQNIPMKNSSKNTLLKLLRSEQDVLQKALQPLYMIGSDKYLEQEELAAMTADGRMLERILAHNLQNQHIIISAPVI